ncbi:superoxide dismutase [Sphingosinicella microcystinivorans]|uniref:superoxide dismutase n=1 Tax=Sphingosinicella microcystinivorans TaxID=335406 RepID=UPI0022F38A12|nr:superoxide dismutase [Sphingosinicella microcystinivorans]WBX85058.1 superoxide dismutase [Sphingosinicella microcystinivorans]
MAIELPPLPFAKDALEPHMSARTLEFHHGKHHKAYVDKANAAIAGTPLEGASLEEIVKTAKSKGDKGLFNNAAQAWNHTFFWNSLSPEKTGPEGRLKDLVDSAFGGLAKFSEAFKAEATVHFGSGWAWLCQDGDGLRIISTHDADSALVHEGLNPLLTLDVWEHAYYLDYQNARPDFVDVFLTNTINWSFAATNLR